MGYLIVLLRRLLCLKKHPTLVKPDWMPDHYWENCDESAQSLKELMEAFNAFQNPRTPEDVRDTAFKRLTANPDWLPHIITLAASEERRRILGERQATYMTEAHQLCEQYGKSDICQELMEACNNLFDAPEDLSNEDCQQLEAEIANYGELGKKMRELTRLYYLF